MIQAPVRVSEDALEERLERGAQLLFDLESRGDMGPEYRRWLHRWEELLAQYERREAA